MTKQEILQKNLTIYRNEIWSITGSILKLRDNLFTCDSIRLCGDMVNDEPDVIMSPDPEPHELISSILNNASRLHKLFLVASQRQGESDLQYEFRKGRGELVRTHFLGKPKQFKEIFKSRIRNSIEHFDERTDALLNALIENDLSVEEKLIVYNLTINYKDYFNPWDLVLPIKVLVVETWEYFMVNGDLEKESINLKKLFEEVEKIQAQVRNYIIENYPEGSVERNGTVAVLIPINQNP
ncbi:MAG: hypothetical protein ACJA1C_001981 [Crocinitomicaceae bacterium]|jgi:hypothetical protein